MGPMRCILHGSFRHGFDEILRTHGLLTAAGVEVLAPRIERISGIEDGFARFAGEEGVDARLIELRYLHRLKALGPDDFSYFVNPEGRLGVSASYELGIAQLTNTRCLFTHRPSDHPAYVPIHDVWTPERLAERIATTGSLPARRAPVGDERTIAALFDDLMVPGSVVAAGAIIEHPRADGVPDILLVRTHKWGGRWSCVGGKLRRGERLVDGLRREVREETGLAVTPGRHLTTFDQIKGSGYYRDDITHIFSDFVVRADTRQVRLNEEAQEHVWMPARIALADLDIEPNARHIVELYTAAST